MVHPAATRFDTMQLLAEEERRLASLDEEAGLTSAQLGQLRRVQHWRQGREEAARARKQQLEYMQLMKAASLD